MTKQKKDVTVNNINLEMVFKNMDEQLTVTIKSIAPMLHHNVTELANPLSDLTKLIKEFTKKRTKSDIDQLTIGKLEWLGGLYVSPMPCININSKQQIVLEEKPNTVIEIPNRCIKSCIVEGAKKEKMGKTVQEGLVIEDSEFFFEDKGKMSVEEMMNCEKYISKEVLRVQKSAVVRTRPIFSNWSLRFTVNYDETLFNKASLIRFIETAGKRAGLGDSRPDYGRFGITDVS